jgi:hypothetical protein
MRDREAIIAALLRKAEDRATTGHERAAFLAKAQQLRAASPLPPPRRPMHAWATSTSSTYATTGTVNITFVSCNFTGGN